MTYDQLKTAIAGYFGNQQSVDPNFEAIIPALVESAESRIYQVVRHPTMITRPYVRELNPALAPPYVWPDDCLEVHSIADKDDIRWEYIQPHLILTDEDARPEYCWSVYGAEILFRPDPFSSTILTYYARPESVVTNSGTPLFKLFPRVFLQGALAEAALYLREPDSSIAYHEQKFAQELDQLRVVSWSSRVPAAMPLKVR
jgi:hypothetical protein